MPDQDSKEECCARENYCTRPDGVGFGVIPKFLGAVLSRGAP
jgi:hypothetical protein